MSAKIKLQFDDIQGFVLRGFGKMPCASYGLFSINAQHTADVKSWLRHMADEGISPASHRDPTGGVRQALAFTSSGLKTILQDDFLATTFAPEFVEGMVSEHRSRLLGDFNANAHEHWRWGVDDDIHGVVITTAENHQNLEDALEKTFCASHGIELIRRIDAHLPADGKEPFGFADGISQPIIQGTDRAKDIAQSNPRDYKLNAIACGEIILGYPDGTQKLPRTPAISPALDPGGFLQLHPRRRELHDFGRNGSYMVMRQLAQDVTAFNEFIEKHSPNGVDLAAKMVGREKSGKTLSEDPNATTDNDFDYLTDLKGHGCPLGSHVRRTNPRSTVHASSNEESLMVTNRHRILRRGRVYKNDNGETGLMFICLNASINRQFEFVQSTWSNDPFFQGLNSEVDPLIGTQRAQANGFTLPGSPFRQKVGNLQQWVTVKGGAYFFMPGIAALKTLAS